MSRRKWLRVRTHTARVDQYPVLDPKIYDTDGTSVSFSRQTFVVHKTLHFRRRRDERFRAGVTVARI